MMPIHVCTPGLEIYPRPRVILTVDILTTEGQRVMSLPLVSLGIRIGTHIKTAEQRTIIQQYSDWYTGR